MSKDASEGILDNLMVTLRSARRDYLSNWRTYGDPYYRGGAKAIQAVLDELKRLRGAQGPQ